MALLYVAFVFVADEQALSVLHHERTDVTPPQVALALVEKMGLAGRFSAYALPSECLVADTLLLDMQTLADQEDVYLLVSYARLLNEQERSDQMMTNASVLFTPDGEIGWEYAKAFPALGYEEYMVEAGPSDIPYLDTPYGRIGQIICADMHHPHYIRQAATKDIDLLLDPAFDTNTMTPLTALSSGFRAVENGFTMVRVTGDGYSAVIDPYYRHWAEQNSFEQGTPNFHANVPMVSKKTVYASIGYIFPYVVVLLLISFIVLAITRDDWQQPLPGRRTGQCHRIEVTHYRKQATRA